MRGELPDNKLQEISNKLPKVDDRISHATTPAIGSSLYDFANDKTLSTSLVCLSDAGERFSMARLSLQEAYACLYYYRILKEEEAAAVLLSKYYADYTALFLYAIAEDISEFILHFLDIKKDCEDYYNNTKASQQKKISSNAAKVGVFLKKQFQNEYITKLIDDLDGNASWKKTMKYRNTWVHEKPPIVDGLGIQYSRGTMITTLDDGTKKLDFGGGAPYNYTIDELLSTVHEASEILAHVLSELVRLVIEKREQLGETFDFEDKRITIKSSKIA
jgi:hypothetical protein